MSLTSLECQVSELVHSDTCPRPTTQAEAEAEAAEAEAAELREQNFVLSSQARPWHVIQPLVELY